MVSVVVVRMRKVMFVVGQVGGIGGRLLPALEVLPWQRVRLDIRVFRLGELKDDSVEYDQRRRLEGPFSV